LEGCDERLVELAFMTLWRPRSKFFEDLLGVPESEFRESEDLIRRALSAPQTLTNLSNGKKWKGGILALPTLKSLRNQKVTKAGQKPGKLFVLCAEKDLRHVDIGHLQALPENQNALFQVASNFNGLELMSKFDSRAMLEVGSYIFDRTQGPFASISAGPGLLLRHYFPFYNPRTTPKDWRQKYMGRQLELLGETHLKTTNGYLELELDSIQKELDEGLVKVAHHRDVQVAFGTVRGSEHQFLEKEQQTIDQVFTATADLAPHTNGEVLEKHPLELEILVKKLLTASYEGTLRAALAAGRQKVYLTLIGGGVFCNPPNWLGDVLEEQLPLITESGLTVLLNTYRGMTDVNVFDRIIRIAKSTGGELIVH
jgi:hypothetical protein